LEKAKGHKKARSDFLRGDWKNTNPLCPLRLPSTKIGLYGLFADRQMLGRRTEKRRRISDARSGYRNPICLPPDKQVALFSAAARRTFRTPFTSNLASELNRIAHEPPEESRRLLAEAAWIDLVSIEVENVAQDRESFLARYRGRAPVPPQEEADTLLYALFTVAWVVIRAALEARGIYANHRTQCLDDFKQSCGLLIDADLFDRIFEAWEGWEKGTPSLSDLKAWCQELEKAVAILDDHLGARDGETFTGWPPRTI
jgi:hypothetical protein